ncbi:MAG: M48 family metallopeptidase [Pseudomonadota bacterium]
MKALTLTLSCLMLLAGCADIAIETSQPAPAAQPANVPPPVSRSTASANFRAVIGRVEPVAERECRRRTSGVDCDFKIIIDDSIGRQPNAYQTLDERGRPIIGFNSALIREARNQDELAFILGHEAAHHIEGHIPQTQQTAIGGALAGAVLAGVLGLDASAGQTVTDIGATVGARSYSKKFELEADALGTVIASRAGYDPLRGARFFNRIPDPGDQFLGTHPPNAERIRTVERVAAQL